MSPEIQFLQSPTGGIITIAAALLLFTLTLLWARGTAHRDRRIAVGAAVGTSVLMMLISIVAVVAGWWQGEFFRIPLIVQAAIFLPFSIAGYTLWLGWYRWLAGRTHYAIWIYAAVVLAFIPVVLLVDPIQMQRGHFTLGGGYTVWTDALAGQVVMWSPVAFYELLRRRFRQAPGSL